MKKAIGFLFICTMAVCGLLLVAGPAAGIVIVDGNFDASGSYIPGVPHWDGDPDQPSSVSLRTNGAGQDWYESRAMSPLHPRKVMLYSNTSDGVYGNYTNMARLWGEQNNSGNDGSAYLTQDFDSAQDGTFSLYFDIAVDSVYNRPSTSYDATGFIFVGNNNGGTRGPNSPNSERFVYLGFFDPGGGTSGQSLVLRANNNLNVLGSTTLWYDTWYSLTLDIDVVGNTYDVTVYDKYNLHSSGIFTATDIPAFTNLSSLTALSFMVGGAGPAFGNGIFFVDNVSEIPIPGTLFLFGSGMIGLAGIRRKFKR